VAKLSNSGETRVVKKSIFLWQKEKNQNLLSEKRVFHGKQKLLRLNLGRVLNSRCGRVQNLAGATIRFSPFSFSAPRLN
jgi:predicted GNAT family N-acyltransferase